jgi:hypothetical protein
VRRDERELPRDRPCHARPSAAAKPAASSAAASPAGSGTVRPEGVRSGCPPPSGSASSDAGFFLRASPAIRRTSTIDSQEKRLPVPS